MKALLLSLILAIGVAAPAAAENKYNHKEMEFACELLSLDCTGIDRPTVIVTNLMGALGLYGAYMPGEQWIFIDPQAPDHTYIHELTHYIIYEAGLRVGRCTGEEAARRVHHAWEGTEYNDDWRKRYGCVKSMW